MIEAQAVADEVLTPEVVERIDRLLGGRCLPEGRVVRHATALSVRQPRPRTVAPAVGPASGDEQPWIETVLRWWDAR